MKKGKLTILMLTVLLGLGITSCDRHQLEPSGSIVLKDNVYQGAKNANIDLDILENDDIIGNVTVTVGNPKNGSISLENGSMVFIYTPKKDFVGQDNFTYDVCDNAGNCKTANIEIHILDLDFDCEVNLVCHDDVLKMDKNTKKIEEIADLLSNDEGCEVDLNRLNFEITSAPTHGSLETDGRFIYYSPDSDYEGMDMFEYSVKSARNTTVASSAKVDIAVGVDPKIH